MLNLLNEAVRQSIYDKHGEEGLENIRSSGSRRFSLKHSQYLDRLVKEELSTERSCNIPDFAQKTVIASAKILGQDENIAMEEFGMKFFQCCLKQKRKLLHSIGTNLCDFLNNVDNLYLLFGSEDEFELLNPPTFNCVVQHDNRQLLLHYYSSRKGWNFFVKGAVKCAAQILFSSNVYIKALDKEVCCNEKTNCQFSDNRTHTVFQIWQTSRGKKLNSQPTNSYQDVISFNPKHLNISILTLSAIFPFHIIFDENLDIQQLGVLLFRLIGSAMLIRGKKINAHFEFIRPVIHANFYSIIHRINSLFYIRLKPHKNGIDQKLLELKGQMVHLPEVDSILFLGSPIVSSLEQLQGRGLFLSDIPIHDATRDLMLLSEQALAQDTLKKRMEQLKHQLQQTSNELAHEKRKTEEILESVFPHDVAKLLIHKQPIPARFINNVTMLFSDIVGFTSICSQCAPMEVVEMLNRLYTKFDKLCGELDLFKVETIGDAYVVAGGLQGSVGTAEDARKVAHMGLGMIDAMKDETTPGGIPIQIRVGIHTGSVLSGVVGTKMPRYCLFGQNVTVANKMESNSEPSCVNISPSTVRFVRECSEFHLIPRPGNVLPAGTMDSSDTEVCHFLQYEITAPNSNNAQQQDTNKTDIFNNNKNSEANYISVFKDFYPNETDLHPKCGTHRDNYRNCNTLNETSSSCYSVNTEVNPWIPLPCLSDDTNHGSLKNRKDGLEEVDHALRDINLKSNLCNELPRYQGNGNPIKKPFKETTV